MSPGETDQKRDRDSHPVSPNINSNNFLATSRKTFSGAMLGGGGLKGAGGEGIFQKIQVGVWTLDEALQSSH